LQPKNKRDAMAELNRRGQVCDALAGTGIRVAEKSSKKPPLYLSQNVQSAVSNKKIPINGRGHLFQIF
jgi:hypothetical protein